MRILALIVVFGLSTALISCTDVAPTAPVDELAYTVESDITGFSKSENGAIVTKEESITQLMIMGDSKRDLLAIFYGDEADAESVLPFYAFDCDLPEASVPSEMKTVIHPKIESGMWRFKGSTAVAIYDFPVGLVFPPPEPVACSDYELVAYGTVEQYVETGNDFYLTGHRTLTFGIKGQGELHDALHPGEMIALKSNARAMYNNSDLKNGIYNSLSRNTNIRLFPDPRDL